MKQTNQYPVVVTGKASFQQRHRVLKLGLDVHYRQVTVAMQEDGGRIKAAGKMRHADFLHWVQNRR
jgi:hypothetical protein